NKMSEQKGDWENTSLILLCNTLNDSLFSCSLKALYKLEIISSVGKYNALSEHENSESFVYRHEEGSKSYETIALRFGKIKYVIATTSNNTNIDFLVTLRNKMSEQKGDWENTSLILLCNTLNDSIRGGSRDLIGEGLPLHVNQITD
ncbi:hypothetical protein ACT453_18350, partial [Bacillus sp. D-CC]